MSDRGPNQDFMEQERLDPIKDRSYEDAGYLGTSPDDDEEVQDLGFIVDNHSDRRTTLTEHWQRLDDLDTDEALETNRSGPIPHEVARRANPNPPDLFATDYHISNARGEEQEADFVRTSMLNTDPDMNDGMDDFTGESLHADDGATFTTDLHGHVTGAAPGLGTSVPQDLGSAGFQIRDNPLTDGDDARVSIRRDSVGGVDMLQSDDDEIDMETLSDEDLEAMAEQADTDSRAGVGTGMNRP
ncbi:MAG: hypothetical protein ACK47B_26030 [Armatimonadota bacterium]